MALLWGFDKNRGLDAWLENCRAPAHLSCCKPLVESICDSDGDNHGEPFGKVMTEYRDKVAATGKQCNKLQALEKSTALIWSPT